MMDSVKDSLQEAPDGTHIAIPGTPKSNQSQDNGEGLGEYLNFISGNSSGQASEEGEGTKKPLDQSGKYFAMNSVEDEDVESDERHWYEKGQQKHWRDFMNNIRLNDVALYAMLIRCFL